MEPSGRGHGRGRCGVAVRRLCGRRLQLSLSVGSSAARQLGSRESRLSTRHTRLLGSGTRHSSALSAHSAARHSLSRSLARHSALGTLGTLRTPVRGPGSSRRWSVWGGHTKTQESQVLRKNQDVHFFGQKIKLMQSSPAEWRRRRRRVVGRRRRLVPRRVVA